MHFPEEVLDMAWKRIPPDWVAGEEEALEQLLERLFERRKRVPDLIAACRRRAPTRFRTGSEGRVRLSADKAGDAGGSYFTGPGSAT